jgi:uncharacterized protein (TIGR02268 family)
VLPALCGLVPLLVTLAGSPGDAPSSQVISPNLRVLRVVISEVTSGPVAQVRVSPGFSTTFRFGAPLESAAVVTEGPEERLAPMEVGATTVTLEPNAVLPEAGLLLTVGFVDGYSPSRASFLLVPASGEVDVQVRVVHPPGQAPPRQVRPETPRARYTSGLFARLVLSGRLGKSGVTRVRMQGDFQSPQVGDIVAKDRRLYRSDTLAVLVIKLRLSTASPQPWVPSEAWLLDMDGHVVGRSPVWMDGTRLDPGQESDVAVEVELVPGVSPRLLRLELREKDGGRTVRLEDLSL